MSEFREVFFEDIANVHRYWSDFAASSMLDNSQDLVWSEHPEAFQAIQHILSANPAIEKYLQVALYELMQGLIVSVLTCIDGGTELAEKTTLELVDKYGDSLGEDLHDGYVRHLIDTDRL